MWTLGMSHSETPQKLFFFWPRGMSTCARADSLQPDTREHQEKLWSLFWGHLFWLLLCPTNAVHLSFPRLCSLSPQLNKSSALLLFPSQETPSLWIWAPEGWPHWLLVSARSQPYTTGQLVFSDRRVSLVLVTISWRKAEKYTKDTWN